jgi:hypothetical protein
MSEIRHIRHVNILKQVNAKITYSRSESKNSIAEIGRGNNLQPI